MRRGGGGELQIDSTCPAPGKHKQTFDCAGPGTKSAPNFLQLDQCPFCFPAGPAWACSQWTLVAGHQRKATLTSQ